MSNRRRFILNAALTLIGSLYAKITTASITGLGKNAQKATGTISGTVLGGSDIYMPHSVVHIENTKSKFTREILSEYSGKFMFKDLKPGTYRISVSSMEGFIPVEVELKSGITENVTLRIKPLKISPSFSKPQPITLDELGRMKTEGVAVAEVSDYVYGNYKGELKFPPNADGNPKKAFIIYWKEYPYRFIFSHECSYCPFIEFPSGAGTCYQFFEGNEGRAELFNVHGRRERNTFVEVMENHPSRVWVRWTYFGVNMDTGEQYYRGTEDFWAYPNGMIVRKQTYTSLVNSIHGHSREPIENIGLCPVGKTWKDILQYDETTGEHHALAVLDAFSDDRYDVFWKLKEGSLYEATPRRTGVNWKKLDEAKGVAIVIPMKEGSPFCVFGDASGFRSDFTRLKEHSHADTGGVGWVSQSWDHWPIGWLNSQTHIVDAQSIKLFPNHFSPSGMDFNALPNEEVEKGVYYSLIGVGNNDMKEIRKVAKQWLDKGENVINNPSLNSGMDLSVSNRK